uniref:Uncharacterized protein n=1 Tax=Oryza barthii TaxID=65489 RepID=A0A0D3HKQ1_9ORYZ
MVPPSPPGGWDFHPGNEIRDQCRRLHGTPVHSSSFYCSHPFKLVVDVPRSTFRLEESSIAIALRACLGGSPAGFFVSHLNDRCYSFCVCNKSVGLWIYNLRSYICRDYHMRFFLWRDGGPNWRFEFRRWESEQLSEWSVVKRKKSMSVKSKSVTVASSSIPISKVFNRFNVLDSSRSCSKFLIASSSDLNSQNPISGPKVSKLDWWYDSDTLKGRVLARVWYKDLDSVPQYVVWEQPNAPNGQSWTIYVYTLNGEFADAFPPDDDLPMGEGPVDPNVNFEDAPAWEFGNVQNFDQEENQGWGNWDEGQDNVNDNVDFLPEIPQPTDIMFDKNFVKDASFWSALNSGSVLGSSKWASGNDVPIASGANEILDP